MKDAKLKYSNIFKKHFLKNQYTSKKSIIILSKNAISLGLNKEEIKNIESEILINYKNIIDFITQLGETNIEYGDDVILENDKYDIYEYCEYFNAGTEEVDALIQYTIKYIFNKSKNTSKTIHKTPNTDFGCNPCTETNQTLDIKDKQLKYNEYHNKLKDYSFLPLLERVKKIVHFVSSDLRCYFYSSDDGSKIQDKIKNALNSYAFINQYEIPLFLFDDTVFGSGKIGFLITDKAFYFKESMYKPWKFNFSDIYQIIYEDAVVLINNKKISLTLLSKCSYPDLRNALEYIILTLKDNELNYQSTQDKYTSQVAISHTQPRKI